MSPIHILDYLGIISALIVIAGIIGAAFHVSGSTTALANYKALSDSWKEKYEEQKEISAKHENDLQLLRSQNETQAGQIQTLTQLVTGKAAVDKLVADIGIIAGRIDGRVEEALSQNSALRTDLNRVLVCLDEVKAALPEKA